MAEYIPPPSSGRRISVEDRIAALEAQRRITPQSSAGIGIRRTQHGFTLFQKKNKADKVIKRGGGSFGDYTPIIALLPNQWNTSPYPLCPLTSIVNINSNNWINNQYNPCTVTLRITGVMEGNPSYTGGTFDGTWYVNGSFSSGEINAYYLYVGSDVYLLNATETEGLMVWDYEQSVDIYPGTDIYLEANSGDGLQEPNTSNLISSASLGIYQPFNGQFVQVEVTNVVEFV